MGLELLWKYQELEAGIDKLEAELKASKTRRQLLNVRNVLLEQQNKLKEFENQTEVRQNRVLELVDNFNEVEKKMKAGGEAAKALDRSDDKAVEAARQQAEEIQAEFIKIRRELVGLISELDKTDATLKAILTKISNAKREYSKLKALYDKESASASREAKALRAQCEALAKDISPELMREYARIKKTRSLPVAKIESGQCGGCNMTLPSLTLRNIRDSVKLIECENCGRILFFPQD